MNRGQAAAFAKGRLKRGEMNASEAAYHAHLSRLLVDGRIAWFAFEPMTFRLARGISYKPDFGVLRLDGLFELHEVKGLWTDDARLKIRLAAELVPFRFIALKTVPKSRGGGWEAEDFSRDAAPLLPDLRHKADVPRPVKRAQPEPAQLAPPPLRRRKRPESDRLL